MTRSVSSFFVISRERSRGRSPERRDAGVASEVSNVVLRPDALVTLPQYPFGYAGVPFQDLPPRCGEGFVCPDEGIQCEPQRAPGASCQVDRDGSSVSRSLTLVSLSLSLRNPYRRMSEAAELPRAPVVPQRERLHLPEPGLHVVQRHARTGVHRREPAVRQLHVRRDDFVGRSESGQVSGHLVSLSHVERAEADDARSVTAVRWGTTAMGLRSSARETRSLESSARPTRSSSPPSYFSFHFFWLTEITLLHSDATRTTVGAAASA